MRILLAITTIFFFSKFNAQTLKTYSGYFNKGKATYTYYENLNLERIYHGSYTYKSTGFEKQDYFESKGNFDNGRKTGIWKETKSVGNKNFQIKKIMSGNYQNGKKTGTWKFVTESIDKGKIKDTKVEFALNDSILISKVSFPGYKGSFDESGSYHGEWSIKNLIKLGQSKIEYIINVNQNVINSMIVRNWQTGEVLYRFKNEFDMNVDDDLLATIGLSSINPMYEYEQKLNRYYFSMLDSAIDSCLLFLDDFFASNELLRKKPVILVRRS